MSGGSQQSGVCPPHGPSCGPRQACVCVLPLGNQQTAPVYEGACSGCLPYTEPCHVWPFLSGFSDAAVWERVSELSPAHSEGTHCVCEPPGPCLSWAGTGAVAKPDVVSVGTWVSPARPPPHLADAVSPPLQEAR